MTSDTIQAKLARSLDKANKATPKAKSKAMTAPGGVSLTQGRVLFQHKMLQSEGCTKLSVSLFATDMQRLKTIRAYMAEQGEIISTSQAVKLALRTAALDKMPGLLDSIRNEDGR